MIWWGPKVPTSTVDQLEAFYRESPNSMLGTPIAGPREQDRAHGVDRRPGDVLPRRRLRHRPHRRLHEVRRGGVRRVPLRLPRQGAGGHPRVEQHPGLRPAVGAWTPPRARQPPGNSPSFTSTVAELPFWRAILTLTVWPGRCAREHRAELVGGRRRLARDRDDHVARADPGLRRRAVRRDAADVDAVAGLADRDAEVGAVRVDDLAVLDDLAGDVA